MTLIALIAAISMGDIRMDLRKTPSVGKKPQESTPAGAAAETAVTEDDENVIENDEEKDLEQGKVSPEH
jgi:hypothetical protein